MTKLEALKELAAKIEAGDLFDTNSVVMSREAAEDVELMMQEAQS